MEHSLTKERPVHTWPVGSMGARDQREPAVGVGAVSRGVPVTGDPGDSSVLLPGGSLRGLLCSALHTAQVRSGAGVYPLQGHGVPQHLWLLTLLSHIEMSLQM